MKILALNCGSSSAKYMVYDWDNKEILCRGVVERIGIGDSFCVHHAKDCEFKIEHDCPTHKEAINLILNLLVNSEYGVLSDIREIDAVGHRVLHGGEKFSKSIIIDDKVLNTFKKIQDLGPLHMPANILGIEAAKNLLPDIPHMAVIDTAFHQTMKPAQFLYAVPYEWYEKYGIRRYGFHGTSHLYVSRRAAVLLGREPEEVNLITLHIGNGASVAAVKNGVCYDTSMGLTPLEGLIMGTRAGDHDAALDFYVMQKEELTPKEMDNILNKRSGLLGITGKYSDRRDILAAMERGDERAKLAAEMEIYRIKKYIGAYAAALGRVDAVVWTAGVGEKSPYIRERALEGLEFMGIKCDSRKNRLARSSNAEFDITASDSKVKVFVIPTDEEIVFVEDVVALYENRYDVYTNFKYSFQDPGYRNKMRELEFKKEVEKNPDIVKALANVPVRAA